MYRSIAKLARQAVRVFSISVPSDNRLGYTLVNSKIDRTTKRGKSLNYQSFEPRRMLAGIDFNVATGELLLGGTNGDDVTSVTQSGDTVTANFQGFESQTFNVADVNSILFVGLRGDDFFENQTAIPSVAFGQVGNDTLIGGSGNDRLFGNGQNDVILGNGGDDFIVAGIGDDQVNAGAGNDRILGVNGTNGLAGGAGNDTIFGGNGDDTIEGGSGANFLAGNDGHDRINGGDDNDQIFGGGGDDILFGNGGSDFVFAQGGNDFLSGGAGEDVLGGNDGNDVIQGERGNDRVVGGNGNDRANFSGVLADYDVTPSGPNLRLNDLRGPSFGLNDLAISIEEFSFDDGVRSRDETLNPTVPPAPTGPTDDVREVVTVQPIIASNSNGTNTAEFFGNAGQEADIKRRIDEIFAQANIDVEFLAPRTVNDTQINVGNGGTRSTNDLNQIVSDGDLRGLGSSNRNVIDLYLVEVVPGFASVNDNTANGLAFVGSSGVALHVGDNLVDFAAGRDTIARVTAHEIGHNLGLRHVEGSNNLLSETGNSSFLVEEQIAQARASSISVPV